MRILDKGISTNKYSLQKIEDDAAVLLDEKDQELTLPTRILPKGVKEGDSLVVTISTEAADAKRREQTAKDILNEIFRTN